MQTAFGAGSLYGVSNSGGVQTPVKFGTLQEVSLDISFNKKELYGNMQFPVAIARGTGKITGKAKFASINAAMYNSLFFGSALATGQVKTITAEAASVPAITTYTVTAVNGANFVTDLGVLYAATGLPFTKVASAPTVGQYMVSVAGVYTFAAADASASVVLSYTYTLAAVGNKIVVNNQLLGTSPFFSCYFSTTYNGQELSIQLPQCMSTKLAFSTKLEDFIIPEFDFDVFADASGKVLTISTAE